MGGLFPVPPLERQTPVFFTCFSLSDRDRTEMLYHDHPVLIKPYQIYGLEQESREVSTCKCMFLVFFISMFFFPDGVIRQIVDLSSAGCGGHAGLFQTDSIQG